jgi:hypothetical protein
MPALKARQIRFGVIDRLRVATKQPPSVVQPSNLSRLQRSTPWGYLFLGLAGSA